MRDLLIRIPRLQMLQNPIARNIYTTSRHKVITPHFDTELNHVIKKINEHPANNHALFQYMKERSKTGFTIAQYDGFRTNFFARTKNTIDVVVKALHRAIKEENNRAIVDIGTNLADEAGVGGDARDNHPQLLKDAFNILGRNLFGLPPINFRDVDQSMYLLEELHKYVAMQKIIYSDQSSWNKIAGCMYAHEKLAYQMLVDIFQNVFEPYKEYFKDNPKSWERICAYFDAHIKVGENGISVEEKHGKSALEVIRNMCIEDPKALKQIEKGAMAFLNATADLWSAILNQLIENEKYGVIVPPKPVQSLEQDPSKTKPSSSTSSPNAHSVGTINQISNTLGK